MDREKVINRMETICNICKENTWRTEFSSDTIYPLLRDAIAMLKEQEIIRCKDCHFYLGEGFCNRSGIHLEVNGDWFCADGERRCEE